MPEASICGFQLGWPPGPVSIWATRSPVRVKTLILQSAGRSAKKSFRLSPLRSKVGASTVWSVPLRAKAAVVVTLGVGDWLKEAVMVGVWVAVKVGVAVLGGVIVLLGVAVPVGVTLAVSVSVGVTVAVTVELSVGVLVGVAPGVSVSVMLGLIVEVTVMEDVSV